MPSAESLDAVTVDAAGTAVDLVDPVAPLRRALAERGIDRSEEAVREAFAAEVAFYVPRSHEGRDAASLARLRRDAVAVFLRTLGAETEAGDFVRPFLAAIEFRAVPGAPEALDLLRGAGLRLACVANWDASLDEHLERAGLLGRFDAVVSSAEAGAPKPDPAPFRLALERLEATPERALHIGDEAADRDGARAAGLAFAPTPLVTLPARLGIG